MFDDIRQVVLFLDDVPTDEERTFVRNVLLNSLVASGKTIIVPSQDAHALVEPHLLIRRIGETVKLPCSTKDDPLGIVKRTVLASDVVAIYSDEETLTGDCGHIARWAKATHKFCYRVNSDKVWVSNPQFEDDLDLFVYSGFSVDDILKLYAQFILEIAESDWPNEVTSQLVVGTAFQWTNAGEKEVIISIEDNRYFLRQSAKSVNVWNALGHRCAEIVSQANGLYVNWLNEKDGE